MTRFRRLMFARLLISTLGAAAMVAVTSPVSATFTYTWAQISQSSGPSGNPVSVGNGDAYSFWGTFTNGSNYQTWFYDASTTTWSTITQSGAIQLAVDVAEEPWIVNSANKIYYATGGNPANACAPTGASNFTWVGIGDHTKTYDVSAIDSSQRVWLFDNCTSAANLSFHADTGDTANQVAAFAGTQACSSTNMHRVWVRATNGDLWRYNAGATACDSGGSWTQQTATPGSADYLTSNYISYSDKIYHWNGSSWDLYLGTPPSGFGIKGIGANIQYDGLQMMGYNNGTLVWATFTLECTDNGIAPLCWS